MKCLKPVERFEREHNFYNDRLIFLAICHGDRELCSFDDKSLMQLNYAIKNGKMIESKAFDDSIKKLNNEPPKE
jgi:hypothetical protein